MVRDCIYLPHPDTYAFVTHPWHNAFHFRRNEILNTKNFTPSTSRRVNLPSFTPFPLKCTKLATIFSNVVYSRD